MMNHWFRPLLSAILLFSGSADAQECPAYSATSAAEWRAKNPAFASLVQAGMEITVRNPLAKDVQLYFYEPAKGDLVQTYQVPKGATAGALLMYQGNTFMPGPDWGVAIKAGGQLSCTRLLGSVTNSRPGEVPVLDITLFLQNGRLIAAGERARPKRDSLPPPPIDTTYVTDTTAVTTIPAQRERDYEISVQNNTPWELEVAYTVDLQGSGREETKAWIKIPAGGKQLLFRSKIGAFCIRAEATDGAGKRRGWGGDTEKIVNSEKKLFRCRVLGAKQWTYTATFSAAN
jgi:hypothetical protein